jgi:hypothetical protein
VRVSFFSIFDKVNFWFFFFFFFWLIKEFLFFLGKLRLGGRKFLELRIKSWVGFKLYGNKIRDNYSKIFSVYLVLTSFLFYLAYFVRYNLL